MNLSVELTNDQSERLRSLAEARGLRSEELAKVVLGDWLSRSDEEFDRAANHVIEKNQELYERLG